VLACLVTLPPTQAAAPSERIGTILSRVGTITHGGLNANFGAGTFSMQKVVLRQEGGTLISADEVSVSGAEGEFDNSQWELRGSVHVEYEGAVVDADAAAVVFVDGRVKTIDAQGVTGQPVQFAYTFSQTGRRAQGRAANIAYDVPSGDVHFFNGTWFSSGRAEMQDEEICYNVKTTAASDCDNAESRGTVTVFPQRGERVPPPRDPDRSSAQ
jgi:lipopolysaccharide export system protein LptA